MFVKDKAEILSRTGDVKCVVWKVVFSPMSKSLIFEKFRVRILAVIEEEIC